MGCQQGNFPIIQLCALQHIRGHGCSAGMLLGGPGNRSGYLEHLPPTHIPIGIVIAVQNRLERHELMQSCWT